MGTDALGENLVLIFKYFLSWTLFLAILGVVNHALRKPVARSPLLGMLAIVLFLLGLQAFQALIPWLEVLRPLPFIMLGAAIVLVFKLWNRNHDSPDPVTTLALATLTIFSTVLLLRIFFKTHTYHYGTILAMPATLIFFKFLIDDFPYQIKRISGDHLFFKGAMVAGISLFVFNHFLVSAGYYGKKDFSVASGGNTIVSYNPEIASRAQLFQMTLDILNKEMKEGETLATFPTGTLLNFLAQKENTIDSISYNPGTWKLLGEQRVLKDLQATPPTYIAIVYHDFLEFDTRLFGKDFGKDIYKLISDNYVSFQLIGKDPIKGESFGIHLYKLKTANPALI
jgi:hypothetical protein